MNGATVSCDTTTFKNNSKLYWQYNCDRIWLTLENSSGQKFVIDEVEVELYNLTYRLGYHLIKEFKESLLFRSGCPANGPCTYTLIDKANGKKLKEFDQLICIDTDIKWEHAHKYNFDFIVYLSNKSDNIIIYYVDSKRTLKVPFKENLTGIIPQHQFDEMTLENNILKLSYELDKDTKKTLKIELKNKKIQPLTAATPK
ncbi:hypothetical protein GCM10023092_22620 [Rurimicrobium arvi]|uniref:Uncharacterized protein n=2 Tax=Rurimicrobium arvi TaxID=2049916 RepID=A0ABP8MVE7_9BACT